MFQTGSQVQFGKTKKSEWTLIVVSVGKESQNQTKAYFVWQQSMRLRQRFKKVVTGQK